jgi:hypothetical protein
MATPRSTRDPLFLGRWFDDQLVILCVRWYLEFKLSYRDLVRRMNLSELSFWWGISESDTSRKAGGLMSWAASKAVGP